MSRGPTKEGSRQVGPVPEGDRRANGNLVFDGVTPLARVMLAGKTLEFVLDTGNQGGTQLWTRFAREFPTR